MKEEGATPGRPGKGVGVIVVNYNSGTLLDRCLASLERQTWPVWRVVVVDNASSDGSLDAVRRQPLPLEVVRLDTNTGFAAANNTGIERLGDCEWLALVNPDVVLADDWLERMLAASRRFPDHAAFACRLLMAGRAHLLDGAGDVYHVSGLAWRRRHGQADRDDLAAAEVFAPCAAAALYRRSAVEDCGGFDPDYFCYFEDVDLGFRLRLRGYRCLLVPDAVAEHVGSATTGRDSDFSVYHGHRNLVWTFVKDMPNAGLWRYGAQHVLMNLVAVAWFAVRGRPGVILRAKRDALRGLPAVLRKRRLVQSGRRVVLADLRRAMAGGLLTPYTGRHV